MADDLNAKIPTGDYCRQLIGQPYVTQSELRAILRSRGVFLSSDEKKFSAGPIIKTGFSKKEFFQLKQAFKSREDSNKVFTRTEDWNSDLDLLSAIPVNLDLRDFFDDSFGTVSLVRFDDVRVVDSHPNHVVVDFSLSRNNPIKNWGDVNIEHEGKVEIKKFQDANGKDRLLITGIYTSKETLDFTRGITAGLVKALKGEGCIPRESKADVIYFHSFSNESRVQFINDLSCHWPDQDFYFVDTKDIHFSPNDFDHGVPDEIKWMENKISELRMNGKEIHSTFFISNKKNHRYLSIFENVCVYSFKEPRLEGECKLSIGFSNKSHQDSELVIELISFKILRNSAGVSQKAMQEEILKRFDGKKLELFERYRLR